MDDPKFPKRNNVQREKKGGTVGEEEGGGRADRRAARRPPSPRRTIFDARDSQAIKKRMPTGRTRQVRTAPAIMAPWRP